MRTFILYLLLMATLLPTISSWGIIAHYQLNRKYIARVLCENRDRPELHCDGQCYLAKRLKAQQDKQDKETTSRVENSPVVQLFCCDWFAFSCKPTTKDLTGSHLYAYLLRPYSGPLTSLFQPPSRA